MYFFTYCVLALLVCVNAVLVYKIFASARTGVIITLVVVALTGVNARLVGEGLTTVDAPVLLAMVLGIGTTAGLLFYTRWLGTSEG